MRENAMPSLARSLPGRDDLEGYDMQIGEPPGAVAPTPRHRDVGYFGRPVVPPGARTNLPDVQTRLALDAAGRDNGCTRFLPTPCVSPARTHRVAGGDPDDEGRLVELAKVVDESQAAWCPVPADGCTFHFVATPHASDGKRGDRPRRVDIFDIGQRAFAEASLRAPAVIWGDSALV